MASMLSRLFSNRKHSLRSSFTDDSPEFQSHKPFRFDSEKQIRLLLFQDCQVKGRKLLFDSKTIRRKQRPKSTQRSSPSPLSSLGLSWSSVTKEVQSCPRKDTKTEISDGVTYEYLLPSSDTNPLGEMILGSVALSYQHSVKVHTIRSPTQFMLSMVFPAPSREVIREKKVKETATLHNSASEINISTKTEKLDVCCARSVPLDVPDAMSSISTHRESCSIPESLHSSASNSSLQSHPSLYDSSTLVHSGSYNNLYRRKMRNLTTSLEHGIRYRPTGSAELGRITKRKINFGLGIIISLDRTEQEESQFEDFFFSHILLLECHLHKLMEEVTQVYFERQSFVHKVYEALKRLQRVFQDLYSGPRLPSPLWLSVVSSTSDHQEKYRRFVQEFVALLEEFDTKSTNFFVSTLLTAVLTHHLSWVSSVVPTSVRSPHNYHKRNKTNMMDQLAKSHSYNPLWIQLGDIYGAVGCQPKLTRMVLTGKKLSVIHRFLFAFSYFIRCSDVVEQEQNILSSNDCHVAKTIQNERPRQEHHTSVIVPLQEKSSDSDDSSHKLDKEKGHLAVALPHCASEYCEGCNAKYPLVQKCQCRCKYECRANSVLKHRADYCETEKIDDLSYRVTERKVLHQAENANATDICNNRNSEREKFTSNDPDTVLFFIGKEAKSNNQINKNTNNENNSNTIAQSEIADSHSNDHSYSNSEKPYNKPEERLPDFNMCEPIREVANCRELQLHSNGTSVHQKQKIAMLKDSVNKLGGKSNNSIYSFSNTDEQLMADHRDASNMHVSSKLSTVEEIEEESADDVTARTNLLANFQGCSIQENDLDKVTETNNLSCDCSREKLIQSIGERKHYIQEYHNLRFAPERCSAVANATDNVETICSSFNNSRIPQQVRKGCRSESPEDGYHSMEDTKCSQSEITSKDTFILSQLHLPSDDNSLLAFNEMPFLRIEKRNEITSNMYRSLGWSLMGGISDHFMSCFCLQGIHDCQKDQNNYKRLRDEIAEDLSAFSTFPVLGDVTEAVCILADIDHLKVQLLSSDKKHDAHVTMSPLVSEMCESLLQMCLLNLSPEYCVMYLENSLQELYFKSLTLAEWLTENKPGDKYEKIAKSLKLDLFDIPLLLSIVSGHELYI